MKRFFGGLFLISLTTNALQAQDQTIVRRRIKVVQSSGDTPDHRVFDGGAAENYISVNALCLFSGELQVTYQRRLTDFLAAEVGGGFTWRNRFTDFIFDYSYVSSEYDINYRPSFVGGLKFFPDYDALDEGFFIGVQINYRDYSKTFHLKGDEPGEHYKLVDSKKNTDLGFTVGKEIEGYWDGVMFEYYIGLAFRNVQWNHVEATYTSDPTIDDFVIQSERSGNLTFLLGAKVGYLF